MSNEQPLMRVSRSYVTRKQMREAVYYANAWCDEYSSERPFKLKNFMRLFERVSELEKALEEIAQKGSIGPYEPPRQGHRLDPWYNSLVRCGEIARTALKGKQASDDGEDVFAHKAGK